MSNASIPPQLLTDESVSETSNITSLPPSPSSLKSASLSAENDRVTTTTSEITATSISAQVSSSVDSTSSGHVTATASRASCSASDPTLVTETSDGRDEWARQGPAPVQALGVLSSVSVTVKIMTTTSSLVQVLSHFVDCGYEAAEKDRIHSLLRTVLKHVWPVLRCYW